MAVMEASAAFRLASGIEAEQHLYSFLPMGAVSGRIQQTHVEFGMRFVVVAEFLPGRRDFLERFDHGEDSVDTRRLSLNHVWSEAEAL